MSADPYLPPKTAGPPELPDYKANLLETCFGFQGRITRRTFWHHALPTTLVAGAILWLANFLFPPSYPEHAATIATIPNPIGVALSILVAIPLTWISLALQVKRWHDHSKSAWWLLIWLTPVGPLWALLELGFVRGSPFPNKYGKDPLGPKNQRGTG